MNHRKGAQASQYRTQADEALHRVPDRTAPRTLTGYTRRDVRNTVAKIRGV